MRRSTPAARRRALELPEPKDRCKARKFVSGGSSSGWYVVCGRPKGHRGSHIAFITYVEEVWPRSQEKRAR